MALTSPSTAVAAFDKGRLAAGISASDTTITVGPIYKTVNGVRTKQGFDSTSGECIISQGDFQERISFEGASVNATTKVTSLTTCTRGLPVTNTTANFTGGTGRAWPKGAYITVIDSASYNQSSVFKNVANAFTAANTFAATSTFNAPIIVAGTSSYVKLPELTTTQRDALTGAEGMFIKNSTTGTVQQYVGGAWASVGTDATPNMSTTVAGKGEVATTAEHATGASTGGTGAPLVVPNSSLVKTSAGAGDENKIPVLSSGGNLALGFIGTGTPGASKYVDGASGVWTTLPTSSLGTVKVAGTQVTNAAYTTDAFSNSAAENTFVTTVSPGANALVAAGDTLIVRAFGTLAYNSGSPTIILKLKWGSSVIAGTSAISLVGGAVQDRTWRMYAEITADTVGASGVLQGFCKWTIDSTTTNVYVDYTQKFIDGDGSDTSITGFNTTTSQALSITEQFSAASTNSRISLNHFSSRRELSTAA